MLLNALRRVADTSKHVHARSASCHPRPIPRPTQYVALPLSVPFPERSVVLLCVLLGVPEGGAIMDAQLLNHASSPDNCPAPQHGLIIVAQCNHQISPLLSIGAAVTNCAARTQHRNCLHVSKYLRTHTTTLNTKVSGPICQTNDDCQARLHVLR